MASSTPTDGGKIVGRASLPHTDPSGTNTATEVPIKQPRRTDNKKGRPNYAQLHKKPLPLSVYSLPAFHPTNPLSLLYIAYTFIYHLVSPPSSHPEQSYVGHFSTETRSIHVTDPRHMRALWEMGFFGKGTLSRSEPSWMNREIATLHATRKGGKTAEEATNARREERRQFKLERARLEREKIERQKKVEQGLIEASAVEVSSNADDERSKDGGQAIVDISPGNTLDNVTQDQYDDRILNGDLGDTQSITADRLRTGPEASTDPRFALDTGPGSEDKAMEHEILNQEHLQLTMEEAFFLSYGLGVLDIYLCAPSQANDTAKRTSTWELLKLFSNHSFFPPRNPRHEIVPDDQFLLSYVTYHHFRSLGWVVRPGTKFAVDYLLYQRGPVFSHAEFAIIIVPSYSDPFWLTKEGRIQRRVKEDKDWWWLHSVNRVQSAVLKTLVLAYVDVPAPSVNFELNVGKLLKSYKIREFVVRRWLANRSRD